MVGTSLVERNVHVDLARVLCVACVVIHHAELRFAYDDYANYQGCGYPLSNEMAFARTYLSLRDSGFKARYQIPVDVLASVTREREWC